MICLFKCPGCGGDLHFDVEKGKLVCEICGHEMDTKEYDLDSIRYKAAENNEKEGDLSNYDPASMVHYHCPSCGAVLLKDRLQATCECAYCGTELAIFNNEEGRFTPEKIIPCKLTKAQAEGKFFKWWSDHNSLPQYKPQKMKLEVRGVYVPVWLTDFDVVTDIKAKTSQTKKMNYSTEDFDPNNYNDWVRKNNRERFDFTAKEQTVSKIHVMERVHEVVYAKYTGLPAMASVNFSQERFHYVEPYDYKELEDFNPAYLSGFPAEQYFLEPKHIFPERMNKAGEYGKEHCLNHIITDCGMAAEDVEVLQCEQSIRPSEACYAMFPLWICSYMLGNKKHYVYINGQTGTADGEVITDRDKTKKYKLEMFGVTACFFFFTLLAAALYLKTGTRGRRYSSRGDYRFLILLAWLYPYVQLFGSWRYMTTKKNSFKQNSWNVTLRLLMEVRSTLLLRAIFSVGFMIWDYFWLVVTQNDKLASSIIIGLLFVAPILAYIYNRVYFMVYEKYQDSHEDTMYSDYLEPKITKVLKLAFNDEKPII